MKKIKYFYNTHTLRYEKLVTPLRVKLLRFFGFLSALIVSSAIIIYLYNRFFPRPTDIEARKKYEVLRDNYAVINSKVKTLQEQLAALEELYFPASKSDKEFAKHLVKLADVLGQKYLVDDLARINAALWLQLAQK